MSRGRWWVTSSHVSVSLSWRTQYFIAAEQQHLVLAPPTSTSYEYSPEIEASPISAQKCQSGTKEQFHAKICLLQPWIYSVNGDDQHPLQCPRSPAIRDGCCTENGSYCYDYPREADGVVEVTAIITSSSKTIFCPMKMQNETAQTRDSDLFFACSVALSSV